MSTVPRRAITCSLLALFLNLAFVVTFIPHITASAPLVIFLAVFYIYANIAPSKGKSAERRVRILNGGYELLLMSIICFSFEALAYAFILIKGPGIKTHILIINAVVCAVFLFILLLNGILRIFICSKQLGIMPKILLLLLWWMPIVNIALLKKFLDVSGAEYNFTVKKELLNADRKHDELCKTKYPILMVHGIFFRDWKNFNYWGRIPEELTGNGAVIYYGNQQSAASVEQCANELKTCILKIVEETGCEKVNIIAHSKGGLDSRYAISCLGMGKYTASLTTINTPHYGCKYIGKILKKIPEKTILAIGNGYDSIFTRLGDDAPDFFGGLANLTDRECGRLNEIMKDDPNVLYQSAGSRMRKASGAPFPLNLGYSIIKSAGEGGNDGLVPTKSMEWGNFLGVLNPKDKQGISHGDVIDLWRKDMEGFDVCEFYVDLVHKLKMNGL